jgi:hypothetical protein
MIRNDQGYCKVCGLFEDCWHTLVYDMLVLAICVPLLYIWALALLGGPFGELQWARDQLVSIVDWVASIL